MVLLKSFAKPQSRKAPIQRALSDYLFHYFMLGAQMLFTPTDGAAFSDSAG